MRPVAGQLGLTDRSRLGREQAAWARWASGLRSPGSNASTRQMPVTDCTNRPERMKIEAILNFAPTTST